MSLNTNPAMPGSKPTLRPPHLHTHFMGIHSVEQYGIKTTDSSLGISENPFIGTYWYQF